MLFPDRSVFSFDWIASFFCAFGGEHQTATDMGWLPHVVRASMFRLERGRIRSRWGYEHSIGKRMLRTQFERSNEPQFAPGSLGTVLHGSSSCDVRQTGSQLTSRHQGSQTEGRFYSHQKCGSSLFPLFGSAPVSHRERTKPFAFLGRPIPLGSHSFGPFPAIYPLSSPLVQPMGQHGEDAPPFRSERRSR